MNTDNPGAPAGEGSQEREAEAAAAAAALASSDARAAEAASSAPQEEGQAGEAHLDEPAAGSAEPEQADTHAHDHDHGLHHNHRQQHQHDLSPTPEEQAEPSPLAVLSNHISANFRRAVLALIMACAGLGLTYASGGVLPTAGTQRPVQFFQTHAGLAQTLAVLGAVIFFVFGVSAVRSATREILKTVPPTIGDNRKNGLRWVCLLVGYLVIIFGTLGALNVPIERLLVGGAVTGVILGIAAQQALGNVFAGLLLLITRPFAIGDEISLRSGPMGGVLTGLVADMNLNYVKIVTDRGTVLLPNSTILTASVGPSGVFDR